MKKTIVILLLAGSLQGCGAYQILGPSVLDTLDEFAAWSDNRWKIEDWAARCTRYDATANYGWTGVPQPGVKLTKTLARSLWDHKRGACAQYAAMFVHCGVRHSATCGYIYVVYDDSGSHVMGWIEEQSGRVSRTENQHVFFEEYKSRDDMMRSWLSRGPGSEVIIYDWDWNVLGMSEAMKAKRGDRNE